MAIGLNMFAVLLARADVIDLAASRLALRTPALRAATASTRPNRSAQQLPCGRHGVPTVVTAGPNDGSRTFFRITMQSATGSSARCLVARPWSWMTGKCYAETEMRTPSVFRQN